MFINDEIQRQVLPIIAKATVSSPGEVQERASSLLQLTPGQQVTAEIVSNLPNNLYLARIAGELFKLEIPLNVPPGELLEMTYLSDQPRISFQLLRPSGEAVKLSSLGKWLSDVVNEAPSLPISREPLVDSPGQALTMLAQRLKAALSQGGLFYEAHLAKWAAGNLLLGELFKEPQGKLSRRLTGDLLGQQKDPTEVADPRTLPFIKEQLNLLNNGALAWRGEAWPRQPMSLTVEREGDQAAPEIEATMALELPHLGGVEARLRLGPDGLQLSFACSKNGSAEILKDGADDLRDALLGKNIHVTRMVAKHDDDTE